MNGVIRLRLPGRVSGRRPLFLALLVVAVALVVQALVATEKHAFAWAASSAGVVLATQAYAFGRDRLSRFPLSCLALIGFDAVTLGIPLIAQSATGRSLLYGLHAPDSTFAWIFLTHALILGTHVGYTKLGALSSPGRWLAARVYRPLAVFRMPSATELWLLGALGFVATLFSQVILVSEIEYGDVAGKALGGFFLFIAFPFLIPFRGLFAAQRIRLSPLAFPALAAYFVLLVLLALAANKRLLFSFVGLTLLLALVLMVALGRVRVSSRATLIMTALAIVALPVVGTFENLTTAMEMVRGARNSQNGVQYLSQTLSQLSDAPGIERWRRANQEDVSSDINYSEAYMSSNLLARLVYTKFTDLTMDASNHLGASQRAMLKEDAWTRLKSAIPTPIARPLGLYVDKLSQTENSVGDLYERFVSGRELGSFLTGSSITHSRDILGSAWVPAMVLLYLLIFNIIDAMSIGGSRGIAVAPVAFLLLYQLFGRTLIDDSVTGMLITGLRNIPQTIFLYMASSFVIRALLSIVNAGTRLDNPPIQLAAQGRRLRP